MNENRTLDEGLSYVVFEGERFTLQEAIEAEGPLRIGQTMWNTYGRWPVYSKFFDKSWSHSPSPPLKRGAGKASRYPAQSADPELTTMQSLNARQRHWPCMRIGLLSMG